MPARTQLRRSAAALAAVGVLAAGYVFGTSLAEGTDGTATLTSGSTVTQTTTETNTQTNTKTNTNTLTQTNTQTNINTLTQTTPGPTGEIARGGQGAADLSLLCTPTKLALNNLVLVGSMVTVTGVSGSAYAGARAAIFVTGRKTALKTLTITRTGLLSARFPAPKTKARATARYLVQVGAQKTLKAGLPRSAGLKLTRRLNLNALTASGGTVTISGQIKLPLAKPVIRIVIQRRMACGKVANVATVTPSASGKFRVKITGPADQHAAVYSATTQVRKSLKSNTVIRAPSVVQVVSLD